MAEATKKQRPKEEPKKRSLLYADAVRLGELPAKSVVGLIKQSRVAPQIGRAVVALEDLKEGQTICSYSGVIISDEECDEMVEAHSFSCLRTSYMLKLGDGLVLDGWPGHKETRGSIGNMINDCRGIQAIEEKNCEFFVDWQDSQSVLVLVCATKAIKKGEELWTSYGGGYWADDDTEKRCDCVPS